MSITAGDILKLSNSCSIKELIPIKSIQTKEDIVKYQELGYKFVITEKEIKNLIPNVNTDFIYLQKGLFESICYFRPERIIFRALPIFVTNNSDGDRELVIFTPKNNGADDIYEIINCIEDLFKEGRVSKLLELCPDTIRLELLNIHCKNIDKKILYSVFSHFYLNTNYGFKSLSKDTITYVYNNLTESDKLEVEQRINSLPEEVIIYRGEGDSSTPYTNAFSWTTDIKIATRFAFAYSKESAKVFVGKISRDKIKDYLIDKFKVDEKEVIAFSNDISIVDTIKLPSLNDISQDSINCALSYMGKYKDTFNFFYSTLESNAHDEKHSLRVAFLTMLLGQKYSLNEEQLSFLALAAMMHDIGRTNDFEDSIHGSISYKRLQQTTGIKDEKLNLILEYHCKDDDGFYEAISNYSIVDKEELSLIYKILKDCDALDRVRFGPNDLDVNYLRLDESIQYALIAKQLLHTNISISVK